MSDIRVINKGSCFYRAVSSVQIFYVLCRTTSKPRGYTSLKSSHWSGHWLYKVAYWEEGSQLDLKFQISASAFNR
ncbi:hypothetical protein P7C71_g892, partial [Lecanoromycetidae sp. Uapishka_2]